MARTAKALTPLEVSRIKAPGYYPVGTVPGLALQVLDTGARTWVLRVMIGGKRREMGLGGYPAVTLAGAWEAARIARNKIKDGIDPIEEGRAARSALAAARAAALTFEQACAKFIEAKEHEWKNVKHGQQWRNTLETYAYPFIGRLHVADVAQPHIMNILEPIWTVKPETASRLRGRVENVLDWARVRGYRKGENPARWKGHLDKLLSSPKKTKKAQHHAALPYQQIGTFMATLRQQAGMACKAIEFAILTACRSGEVRGATWTEIDLDAALWVIPAERMKAEREHYIPLSAPAVALLKALKAESSNPLAFPGIREGQLSDMSLTAAVKRMDTTSREAGGTGWTDKGGSRITVHGFRSTFRDWAGETTAYPREVIEHALAHQLKDKAEAAYARGSLLEKRAKLMQSWADFCAMPPADAKVVPINGTGNDLKTA